MQLITYILDCGTCGNPMKVTSANLSADQSDPVEIEIDFAISQLSFDCQLCGGQTYLGDIGDIAYHEEGILHDDDDEYEYEYEDD